MADLSMSVRDWYMKVFPHDPLGKDIAEDLTFRGLVRTLNKRQPVYKALGVYDSTVRARCFMKLSEITGAKYETIYNKWLSAAKQRRMI